jgi:hypothetical protein
MGAPCLLACRSVRFPVSRWRGGGSRRIRRSSGGDWQGSVGFILDELREAGPAEQGQYRLEVFGQHVDRVAAGLALRIGEIIDEHDPIVDGPRAT